MNESSKQKLDELIRMAVDGLFASLGKCAHVEPAQLDRAVRHYAGIIGFGGDAKGSLVIIAESDTLRDIHPVSDKTSDDMIADWLGELTNQLLGRLKNLLLGHGVNIVLSTPVVSRGGEIWSSAAEVPHTFIIKLETGVMKVCLDWVGRSDLEISAMSEVQMPAEGELMLF
jgi:CheY-specific phosphatase CheX